MRIVAYRVSTTNAPTLFGYGISRIQAAEHLSTQLGRKVTLAELHFDPIVVEPEPHSIEIKIRS